VNYTKQKGESFIVYNPDNPIIVQSDKSILVEVNNPLYEQVRDEISGFAELEKSPEHIHTYKISPLSLWNAASSGMSIKEIKDFLEEFSKYDLPQNVIRDIEDNIGKYGKIKLISEDGELILFSEDKYLIKEILSNKGIQKFIIGSRNEDRLIIDHLSRGEIKHNLIKIGFPVEDLAGYVDGKYFEINLKPITSLGHSLNLRDYQREACDIFYANGSVKGGSGVIVLPCGAGKTITAMAVMEKLKTRTLIITTNITALRQWKNELIDKTDILPDLIGEYSGEIKEVKPITITTYQILTHRNSKDDSFPHFELFNKNDWGFIIYDEVHLLPAPVFRITSQIQAKRRLGLTATLVREDDCEEDVFSLIGPKKYDVPWKVLEGKGWIACAKCFEIRVPMPDSIKMEYAVSPIRDKFRIASENFSKIDVIDTLLQKHKNDNVLIIGQYIEQLEGISKRTNIPIITGKTHNEERIRLYEDFKKGILKSLIVSKVANFAIDLPDANVAIQISGTFGSRQEEAQRLGRILRPKSGDNTSFFYSVVTKDSREQDFAANRQLFLTEQGYKYFIRDFNEGWEN
jgi:DNA excision repair protein ERCC-3